MSEKQNFLIIDDHEAILAGTLPVLQQRYPQAKIATAHTAQAAKKYIEEFSPNFVIVDLHLPESTAERASVDVGLSLLNKLMNSADTPHIMVLSINVKPLLRMKPEINAYEGGFVAVDKSLPLEEMLLLVETALRGSIYLPPEIRSRPEFDRRWLKMLQLKYQEGLSDAAIAQTIGVTDRTVRNYWVRIQDALNVPSAPNQDVKIQIELTARRIGLIS